MSATFSRNPRLWLALVGAALILGFTFNVAEAQFGPKPPTFPNRPGNNPPANNPFPNNNPFEHSYRCSKCGTVFTSSAVGGPSHCPSCGVKFINGGFDLDPQGPRGPVNNKAPQTAAAGQSFLILMVVVGFLVIGGIVVLGGGLALFFILKSRAPQASARRRPRLVDNYDA